MKARLRSGTSMGAALLMVTSPAAIPASAQTISPQGPSAAQAGGAETTVTTPPAPGATQSATANEGVGDIIVTAQRQSESLQRVPIAVSAFTAATLQSQQIENANDLQLSLPNVTFTKTNFTGASFTIRGVGDLCVGTSCDQATAIHVNDMPLQQSRVFETEFFDLERIEVLRGPQGTLFGRNATAGVVNFITARPALDAVHADGQVEYGNYDSRKLTGMLNLPITDTVGVRLAGTYLKRQGYTRNTYDGSDIDGRDLYALRGTLRFKPTERTTLDVIGYYFRERDDRTRFQKQLCSRDATGILGCRPDRLGYGTTNGISNFGSLLTTREFLTISAGGNPLVTNLGLGSLYGTDPYSGAINPADLRTVNADFTPRYSAQNYVIQGRLEQKFGDSLSLTVTGGYNHDSTDQRSDFNNVVADAFAGNAGLTALAAIARTPNAAFPGGTNPFAPAAAALFPNGLAGGVCTSEPTKTLTGIYGGNVALCAPNGGEFDSSRAASRQYSIEAHLDSSFDGPFNFLVGGILLDNTITNDYFVDAFTIDYASGVLGAATTLGQRAAGNTAFPNVYLAPPFFDGQVSEFRLKSYGVFGEAYLQATDRLKLTAGLRYSNDRKEQVARNLTISFPTPYGLADANLSPFYGQYDADASLPGNQATNEVRTRSDALTGRFVVDYQLNPRTMFYASYSRGYKSGGINPPVPAVLSATGTFRPERIDAVEIGTKSTLLDGTLRLNASAFYYRYKDLQISRLVARAAVNDNADADIYGVEAEAIISPIRNVQVNLSASYLNTRIKELDLIDPRDPSGGRSDAVIVKDITSGSNCVVRPNVAGNAAGANLLVTAFNAGIGLRGPVAIAGTNTTGAFGVCNALATTIAAPPTTLRALFGTPTGALPFTLSDGVSVTVAGNRLPQSPEYKLSAGAQYKIPFGNGFTVMPRVDLNYTGEFYSRAFNTNVDRIEGYAIVNALVQLDGPDNRYFIRGFVQNLTNNNAITGKSLSDQSTGLFTNLFVLEPRRYGIAAGFRF